MSMLPQSHFLTRRHSRHAPHRPAPRTEIALENYWAGTSTEALSKPPQVCAPQLGAAKELGVTVIPSNDFSLYDQVLDTSAMVGAVPAIYGWKGGAVRSRPISRWRAARKARRVRSAAMRITVTSRHGGRQEMTKWFDTNYHYMVPELTRTRQFRLASTKPIDEYEEAKALGYQTRPVLLGPVTYLKLAKSKAPASSRCRCSPLLPVYIEVLRELASRGAEWVQIDEPCLVLDLDSAGQRRCLSLCDRPRGAAAQDHADDLFRRTWRQSRYRAGAPRRRPAPRSRPRAGPVDGLAEPEVRVLSLG